MTTQSLVLPIDLRATELSSWPAEGWPAAASGEVSRVCAGRGPVRHVDPVAVAMLSAWALRVRHAGGDVDVQARDPVLFRSGVLDRLAGRNLAPEDLRGFAPAWLEVEQQLTPDAALDQRLDGLGMADEDAREATRYCIEDLARNVFHHARSRGGGAHVAASYDPKTHRVRIGVADSGIGIAADIRANTSSKLSDLDAVRIALEPRVSGSVQTGLNMGVGLFMVRRIALAARGAFWLRTGRVTVEASSVSPDRFEPQAREEGPHWQGTAVAVTFHANAVEDHFGTMRALRAELEGRGPAFHDIAFFKVGRDEEGWVKVIVGADTDGVALDRNRARALAVARIEPALARGEAVEIDCSGIRYASQAFMFALLGEASRVVGPSCVTRMRFVACSNQAEPLVRMAVHEGLQRHQPARH